MTEETVIGVLLAGGQSRRFGGGDKTLSALAGKSMLAHAIDRLSPQVSALVLNANGDPARFANYDLTVIADPVGDYAGPLAGVLAGLDWAARESDARWVVTAAGDSPLFPNDLVARLMAAAGDRYPAIALAACGDQIHPTFGLWPVALAGDLRDALKTGVRRIVAWTENHDCAVVDFGQRAQGGQSFDPFFNVNTREDLQAAEALLAGD
jgi:molybdopterin-guanine dinucleotide biosynthesis protein A